jgi:hypothetical protein
MPNQRVVPLPLWERGEGKGGFTPRIFTLAQQARMAEANRALRQLRALGCRPLCLRLGDGCCLTEIVIDRNPHRCIEGCPGVHVTVRH